jgi:phage protein U
MREEESMQMAFVKKALPQVTAEQRAESDRVKRIRKLRWVGMDDEARVLQGVFDPEHADSVLAIPHATD